jgi:competence protein ComEA
MDAATVPPSATGPPASVPPPAAPLAATWPRSARYTVGVLLGVCALLLFGQSFLTSFGARPTPSPAPRLELNSAGHADLLLLPGIGDQLAGRIVKHRQDRGPFEKIDDLRKVPGIGPKTLDRVKELVYLDPPQFSTMKEAPRPAVVEPAVRPGVKSKKAPTEPIEINSASVAELQQLPGIGPKKSQQIVAERARKPFTSITELRRVPGIGPKTFEKIKPFIKVD